SENEATFRDDPIGMELFLFILRDDPRLGLAPAAERLGRSVVRWYADKGLARTEEPTLWSGLSAPRPLAARRRAPPGGRRGVACGARRTRRDGPSGRAREGRGARGGRAVRRMGGD